MFQKKNRLLVSTIALMAPLSLQAAEWSMEPKISLRTGYNDNIRLTSFPHDSVWEAALTPSVKFAVAKELSGLSGDARVSVRRFTGGSGNESSDTLDREDYHLGTDAWYNTQRDSLRANLDFTRDSTLDSELDETGNVVELATRERFTLGPSWTRVLTELTRLELTYQYSNVDFSDDPGPQNLVNYDFHVASASLLRQFTPRIQGTLAAGYSSYRPESNFDSDTLSLQVGLSNNFSETLVGSFLVGLRQTTSDSSQPIGTEDDTNSPVYSASLTRTLENGSFGASLSRSTTPGGDGELLDSTRLVLTGEYKLTETVRTSLRAQYAENETIVNRIGIQPSKNTEDFFRVTPKIHWRWAREWSLTGEYQYARDDNVNNQKATRNAVYLTLSYLPPKRSISR
ncbi:MAG: outer membrane beta-barrel protein [Gammaproteobacteria bacterium]